MPEIAPKPIQQQEVQRGGAAAPLVLHLWRRLDWRFLLPNPQPRRVGFGGAMDSAMLDALTLLDPDAAQIDAGEAAPRRLLEVVLLYHPDARLIGLGAEALQPGGSLCILVRRSFRIRTGPMTLLGWRRRLVRQGFQEVSVHWFAPTLDVPSRIVPVGSRTAVLDTLARHKSIRFGSLKQYIGRLLLDLGLFAAVIPEGAIIGHLPLGEKVLEEPL